MEKREPKKSGTGDEGAARNDFRAAAKSEPISLLNFPRPRGGQATRWIVSASAATISLMVFVLLVLRVLSHAPFFDESFHVHFLWLLSTGLKPEADYFCQYPALAYIVAVPLVKMLPASVYILLVLRGTSVVVCCLIALLFYRHGRESVGSGIAGLLPCLLIVAAPDIGAFLAEYSIDHLAALTAIGAMTLFFRPRGAIGVGTACGLSLLSVAITPKYILPLFFGLLGALAAALYPPDWRRRGAVAAAAVMGSLAAALLVVALFWLANISLADNFRYSHLLMSRLNLSIQNRDPVRPLGMLALQFVSRHWLLTIVLLAGLACWGFRRRREGLLASLPGAGVILGMAAFTFLAWKNLRLEQYMTPMLFSTALFAPYGFPKPNAGKLLRWLQWLLLAAAALDVSVQLWKVPGEFRQAPYGARNAASLRLLPDQVLMQPPVLKCLGFYDSILHYVPENERVVAMWPYHPLLRRDLTWVTNDEIPSYSQFMAHGDPALKYFERRRFSEALESNPPAMIALRGLHSNYPAGWDGICTDFLRHHLNSYLVFFVDTNNIHIFLRRDLVPDQAAATARFRGAMEIDVRHVPVLMALGDQFYSMGSFDEAIANYRKATEIEPDNVVAHSKLGISLAKLGRFQEADEQFQKAVEKCGENQRLELLITFGDKLTRLGRLPEALQYYGKALDLASQQRDKPRAEEISARIKRLSPNAPPGNR
jgi:tetratricopeptide (TPR) repeat protein